MRRILLVLATMLAAVLVASGVALAKPIKINDATFDDTTQITTVGTADPYPAEITVSGLGTNITDVNLELSRLTHTFPQDVDMLLVGPQGQEATVMSDAGSSFVVRNVTLVLDDQATNGPLPEGEQITSGTYAPANYGGGDNFPANPDPNLPDPPSPSGGSALSVFNGTNPNGTWELYIVDGLPEDKGHLADWSLEITTTP